MPEDGQTPATRRWRRVAFVGGVTGGILLITGVGLALSLGTPDDPHMAGVILAALGFIGLFAAGFSLLNLMMFRLLGRLRDLPE